MAQENGSNKAENPQQNISESLEQINQVCFWLQGFQLFAVIFVVPIQYLSSGAFVGPFYAALLAFVAVGLAHAVASYVLLAMARNISTIGQNSPSALTQALDHAIRKPKTRTLPLLAVHAVFAACLLAIRVDYLGFHGLSRLVLWLSHGNTAAVDTAAKILGWFVLILGAVSFQLVRAALKSNTTHLIEYLNISLGHAKVLNARAPDA